MTLHPSMFRDTIELVRLRKGLIVMGDLLSYKNYNGTVEYSKEDGCFFGKVIGIKSLLSYEGNSIQELEKNFQTTVDEYIADCNNKAYQLAMNNTTYNSEGRAVISKDDEWAKETEWDDVYAQMIKE